MPLPYAVREGLAGFRRAPLAAFAATAAMAVALVLVGVFAAVVATGSQVTSYLEARIGTAEVYLRDDADSLAARVLVARFGAQAGVVATEHVTRAEAARAFAEAFGDDARLFDDTFLPASIRVTFAPAYAREDSMARFAALAKSQAGVDDVVYDAGLFGRVQRNLALVRRIGAAICALVVLAALFLVANTIRLTIYARRLVIRTMKLVGATDAFVRRPFLVEGLVQGLAAGLLAALVLAGLAAAVRAALPSDVFGPEGAVWLGWVPLGAVALGLGLGGLTTAVTLRRFIRRVALH